ncbi:single-stranded DNA-binding protein [Arthrobacter castelli]|uniref:single-stranded DNA-binding protein n=1 Tax=Arthrobacter castelli TaxID=271431 RepID=UPI000428E4FF|nr:single-stranded DNA-binding protein [Arthrobacter castelli]
MSITVTVRGFVASDVRRHETQAGDELATFRLGSTDRRFNRQQNTWEDGETNWFSVSGFRGLARNVAHSLRKGQKVVVHGRLRIWPSTRPDGTPATNIGIDAETVGHDLGWGISEYQRNSKDAPIPWVAVQAPELGTETSPSWVNTETGEIPETEEPEEAGADAAWQPEVSALDEESPSETPDEAGDTVQAA